MTLPGVPADLPAAPDPPDGFVPVTRRSRFFDLIGPLWVRPAVDGHPPVYGLRVRAHHTNSRGTAHGGLLMTMADVVLGYTAGLSREPPVLLTTASMTVDFAGSAAVGDWLEGRADVQRVGRTLAFVNGYLSVGDRRIIRASSVFTVSPRPDSD